VSFRQIRGQKIPLKILLNSLNKGVLSPSYIFTGPEGIGKRTVALNFAKTVNCLKVKEGDCCDHCLSCLKIQNFNHPDVHWIKKDESDSIKIETIRELQKNIYIKPWEAKRKVFIIEEADRLTPEAQNSLLKVLEEPPKENILILITSKPNLIFSTVISRCKRINFTALNSDFLKEILIKDFNLGDSEAHFLAYFSEGRLGRAIEFKDRDFFKQKNFIITNFLFRNLEALYDKEDFNLVISVLLSWFRDLLLLKRGISRFSLIHIDQRKRLLDCVDKYEITELEDIFKILKEAYLYKEFNVNLKLILNYIKVNLWKR